MTRLDFDTPIARRSDPDTSKQAAREVTAEGIREAHAVMLLDMIRQRPGHTLRELSDSIAVLDAASVSKRLSDLHAKGLIWPGSPRRCSISGRAARVWYSRRTG